MRQRYFPCDGEKRCAKCDQVKPHADFYLNARGQIHSYCKACLKVYTYYHYQAKSRAQILGEC